MIDIAAVMRQLDAMLGQIVQAISLVFGFAMLAGMAVLYAALQSGSDERQHELAVLRALGARHGQLRRALLAEFLMLGAVAGLLAGFAASLIGWGLAHFAFPTRLLRHRRAGCWPVCWPVAASLPSSAGWVRRAC